MAEVNRIESRDDGASEARRIREEREVREIEKRREIDEEARVRDEDEEARVQERVRRREESESDFDVLA